MFYFASDAQSALDQVGDAVGLIAWTIAKVWAIGCDPGRLAEGPLGDQWRVWAIVEGARLGVIPQDAAIVGRTPLAVPATFTVSPTGTYADMHVVTA